jgi:ParB family chromosome partitioning protein
MKLETVPLGSISFDPANTRKHSRRNLDAIKASLRRFGQQKPIVVDAKGIVLAGNGTLAAATELGWSEIQIVRTALAGVDATAFGIADNRTAELAEWDENLGDVLASLEAEDFPLAEIGFTPEDLKKFEIAETEMPELSREDRAPFQQKTFTLHDNQAKLVDEAIEAAKKVGGGASLENENSNGNALAFICAEFLKGKH